MTIFSGGEFCYGIYLRLNRRPAGVLGGDHAELEHLLEVLLGAATEDVERIAGDPICRPRVVALRMHVRLHLGQHLLDEAAHRRGAKNVLLVAFSGGVGALGEGLSVRAAHGCSILASLLATLWPWERQRPETDFEFRHDRDHTSTLNCEENVE